MFSNHLSFPTPSAQVGPDKELVCAVRAVLAARRSATLSFMFYLFFQLMNYFQIIVLRVLLKDTPAQPSQGWS